MRKHSTKRALEAVQQLDQDLKHVESVLRAKQLPIENQADWVKNHSEEYWLGWIHAKLGACETILHNERSYYGFGYVDQNGNMLDWFGKYKMVTDHPEYRNWRVEYYTK